jgi:hypothetical protein
MEEKGERMRMQAEEFSSRSNALLDHYKNKKWYEF